MSPAVFDAEDGSVTMPGLDELSHPERGFSALPEFLRAAVEWLPTGILIVNADSAIVVANREIERVFALRARS
jgi:hypothetical protein